MTPQKKIKWKKKKWFNDSGNLIYLLFPIAGLVYVLLLDLNLDKFPYVLLLFAAVVLSFIWLSWHRRSFQECEVKLTENEFIRAVHATAKELDWEIVKLNEKYVQANRFPEYLGNGGELIVIRRSENKFSIHSSKNSDDYDERNQGYSAKRNRENVNSFLSNVEHILAGKNIEQIITERKRKEEEDFWNESEWTIKKIFKRIIGYGLSLVFLLIGIIGIHEGIWEGLISVITSIVVGFTYIKYDIQVIREKKKKSKTIIQQ